MSGTSNRHLTGPAAKRALAALLADPDKAAWVARKLDEAGFCIVTKYAAMKPPEGRGNEAFKKVKEKRRIERIGKRVSRRAVAYTGPDLIGTSHSQSLLNGGLS